MTHSLASRRARGRPISRHSAGDLSGTSWGSGSAAASRATSPNPSRRSLPICRTAPRSARHSAGGHPPAARRRGDEEGARDRPRPAQGEPPLAHRAAPPGEHHPPRELGVAIRLVRRCLLHLERLPVGLELLGHEHREGGAHPLPHLAPRQDDRDRPVPRDPEPGIGGERRSAGGRLAVITTRGRRDGECHPAGRGGQFKEAAAVQPIRALPRPRSSTPPRSAARWWPSPRPVPP